MNTLFCINIASTIWVGWIYVAMHHSDDSLAPWIAILIGLIGALACLQVLFFSFKSSTLKDQIQTRIISGTIVAYICTIALILSYKMSIVYMWNRYIIVALCIIALAMVPLVDYVKTAALAYPSDKSRPMTAMFLAFPPVWWIGGMAYTVVLAQKLQRYLHARKHAV